MNALLRGVFGAVLVLSVGLLAFPWVGVPYILIVLAAGALFSRAKGEGAPSFLSKVDDLLYEGEKLIVSVALIVMTVTVFVDVVWRTARSADLETATTFIVIFFVLSLLGGFTRRVEGRSTGRKVAVGLGAFAGIMLSIGIIYLAPNGFGWSQRLSLVLIMWVGLLGSSMAAKTGRHITVDAVRRLVPEGLKRPHEIAAGIVTVSLCALLSIWSIGYVRANWQDWVESERTAGIFESLPIPYWAATMPILIGFALTGARFFGVIFTGAKEVDLLASHGGAQGEGASEAHS